MSDQQQPVSQRTLFTIVMVALGVWAGLIAVGTYLRFNLTAALVVLVCMAVFVGCWLLLLRIRGRGRQP